MGKEKKIPPEEGGGLENLRKRGGKGTGKLAENADFLRFYIDITGFHPL
ncbi:hypothetical protein [Zongyangia hominis]|uniref:Uncharacterized protein n=1 Tax=Zongyangia hominis TaxID=2763677 RepID=A0A926EEZ4_9FIRM|nr:hypothetical protein [Zongyangia hominis]MBC8570641.1 hypothetical protein [Zongyangia hominis]